MTRNEVLAAFKSTGKAWQSRMNDALKEWLEQLRLFEFMSLKEHNYSAQSANASPVEGCRKS
ncbi:MAG: hypothetical protein CTY19_10715 [Methylomonas sp.]|nr:MAG: hypothetical protein CTY19_10715 [Methylomonas sp.]